MNVSVKPTAVTEMNQSSLFKPGTRNDFGVTWPSRAFSLKKRSK
jgi:hypothetical protein